MEAHEKHAQPTATPRAKRDTETECHTQAPAWKRQCPTDRAPLPPPNTTGTSLHHRATKRNLQNIPEGSIHYTRNFTLNKIIFLVQTSSFLNVIRSMLASCCTHREIHLLHTSSINDHCSEHPRTHAAKHCQTTLTQSPSKLRAESLETCADIKSPVQRDRKNTSGLVP